MSDFFIRHSRFEDIPVMKEIFEEAKVKMRQSGNMLQWAGDYPQKKLLEDDIQRGFSYVVEYGGRIVATFVLAECIDPTYNIIVDGQWLDDSLPYGTIHRIASRSGIKGIARFVFGWSYQRIANLRIDTHKDNKVMQHIVKSNGFHYCGIIYLANGDERLAYQKIDTI